MIKKKINQQISDFFALRIKLASPENIDSWSSGEVTKAETINYRTYKPEPDGLFCEKIFGPIKNFECYCGKYKKIKFKGIICDKCGVEITTSDVRRERMGHIELAVPVSHVWFAYGVPNKLSMILNISHKKLLSVLYYSRYMVVEVDDAKRDVIIEKINNIIKQLESDLDKELEQEVKGIEDKYATKISTLSTKKMKKEEKNFEIEKLLHKKKQSIARLRHDYAGMLEIESNIFKRLIEITNNLTVGTILTEDEYVSFTDNELVFFDAKIGADAISDLLKSFDIDKEIIATQEEMRTKKQNRTKNIQRLKILQGMKKNGIKPDWIILKNLPVIPPDLRPIIPLAGGKFATHDLNDLYRRIINRNNRLKKLIQIGAPDIIMRNEKRMLQEAVDALIDNSHRPGKPMMSNKRLPYNSLTDQIRGKKGIFRKNLLGKRVDYSGRAVIVGDATLKIDQCGLPKAIALEIYKPFVMHELLENGHAPNIKVAKDIIEEREEMIWDYLENIITKRPVLLNRAPTLHKYSIQAFYPILVEGDAIHLHPLVCKAFNADFDGDQMSVHVLLTDEAVEEVKLKVMASKNITSFANGKTLAYPTNDMVLGFFILTDINEEKKPKVVGDFDTAVKAYQTGQIGLNEMIYATGKGGVHKTSAGRIIFNQILPEDYPFVNERIGGSESYDIIEDVKAKYPREVLVELLDTMKKLGFQYATDSGFSFSMSDCSVDMDVKSRVGEVEEKDEQLEENYLQGLIVAKEKNTLSINMWNDFADKISEEAWGKFTKNNPVFEMVESKANGGKIQVRQVATVIGMVRDSTGKWVPLPIKGNYRDGLNAFEYFVASNGGRKGQADQSLRTPFSGYLTRRLVDVAHSVIVRENDCGYDGEGIAVNRNDVRRLSFEDRVFGRVLAQDVIDSKGNVVVEKNTPISRDLAIKINKSDVETVYIRTPLLCKAPIGMCRNCYGYDYETNEMIEMGKAVGVIAAQSIGEPGTQLTMKTFHKGGIEKTDITQGLPRVEELLEARKPKSEAEIASIDGVAHVEKLEDESFIVAIEGEKKMSSVYETYDAKKIIVEDGATVRIGDVLYIDHDEQEKQAPYTGEVRLDNGTLTISGKVKAQETISVLPKETLLVKDGDKIVAGQPITEGSIDPQKLVLATDIITTQKYIVDQCQQVFNEQGVALADIHFEVIVRQMNALARINNSGDTEHVPGSLISTFLIEKNNELLRNEGKRIVHYTPRLMGIKMVSLNTDSFLSAMSFQEHVRVLTEASLLGKIDYLRGMKENVMIGKRIPSGEEAKIDEVKDIFELSI